MIRLYLEIPEVFVRLVFPGRFLFVNISFFRMVKFQFLAQFLVDHLANIVLIINIIIALSLVLKSLQLIPPLVYH